MSLPAWLLSLCLAVGSTGQDPPAPQSPPAQAEPTAPKTPPTDPPASAPAPQAGQPVQPVANAPEKPATDAPAQTPATPALPPAIPTAQNGDVRPTLGEIFKPPRMLGVRADGIDISADGRFVTFRWTDQDAKEVKRDTWIAGTDPAKDGPPRKLFDAKDEVQVRWTRTGSKLLVQKSGWLSTIDYANGIDAAKPRPLLETGGAFERVTFFDDDRRVAFIAGEPRTLFVLDLETGERKNPAARLKNASSWFQVIDATNQVAVLALSSSAPTPPPATAPANDGDRPAGRRGGGPPGDAPKADGPERVMWLLSLDDKAAAVETKITDGGQLSVSSDAKYVVRTRRESAPKRRLIMADYLTESVTAVDVRDDIAGDPGQRMSVEFFDVATSEAIPAPLDAGTNFWDTDASWSKKGHLLLMERVSNDWHVRQVMVVDPERRAGWPVFSETDDAWIGGPLHVAQWAEHAEAIVFTSEQSGFNQLYRVDAFGGEPKCLTDAHAAFEISDVSLVRKSNVALVTSNEGDTTQRHLWAVDLDKGERRRLTPGTGVVADVHVASGGSAAAYTFEPQGVPADVCSIKLAGGEPTKLSATVPKTFAELALPAPEIIEYVNPADGTKVKATLYKPQPFDPTKKYPAVVFIHGAGYLQNVLRSMTSYPANVLFHHRLARKGYVVLDPDYRHSEGYGRKFRADVYGFMGGKDLDDVVAGVEWMKAQGYVDGARVGIYGGSYGGFMTLMALFTKPDVFACGAALRSVTDWRTYNAWYTNPRLGDPKKDEANYKRSSPIDHADGLKKPLLLLHGLKDSNVFAQDTIRLVEKLISLGKDDFEVMLYPSQDHGFTDPDSWLDEYKRIEKWFDRWLKPGT